MARQPAVPCSCPAYWGAEQWCAGTYLLCMCVCLCEEMVKANLLFRLSTFPILALLSVILSVLLSSPLDTAQYTHTHIRVMLNILTKAHLSYAAHSHQSTSELCCTFSPEHIRVMVHIHTRAHQSYAAHSHQSTSELWFTFSPEHIRVMLNILTRAHQSYGAHSHQSTQLSFCT
jgi:hypothetical protein